jgi:hypothetical protein
VLPAIAPRLLLPLQAAVGAAVALAGFHVLLVPLAMAVVLALIVANELITGRIDVPTGIGSKPVLACAGILCWAAIGSVWALKPEAALSHALLFMTFLAGAVVFVSWLGRLPQEQRIAMLWPVIIGWCAGVAFVGVELMTSGSITRAVAFGLYELTGDPALARPKYVRMVKAGSFFNRNAAALVMLLPAVVIAYAAVGKGKWGRYWLPAVMLVAAVLDKTQSSTAVLAFLCAVTLALFARHWPTGTALGLRLGFATLLLLAIPLARVPYALGLSQGKLPHSFQERALIWEWTAAQTLSRPPIGVGIFGSQSLQSEWKSTQKPVAPRDKVRGPMPDWHPHNGYLELWTELGLPGVLLTLVFGWELLRKIETFSRRVQPALMGFAGACLGGLGTGWSLWQPWLMAVFTLSLAMTAWAAIAADRLPQASEPE